MLHLLYALLATARSSLRPQRELALEQLVRVAKERFGGQRVRLLGSADTQDRLAEMAAERGLETAEERQR